MSKKTKRKSSGGRVRQMATKPKCGLCGKSKNLMKTECCDQLICDDEDNYVLFSFARNSCSRNHRRYTLCGFHDAEGHEGDWKECAECREGFESEIYVHYGTNEYNFEKLPNPPSYKPAKCHQCSTVIHLSLGGYSESRDGYSCGKCTDLGPFAQL